VAALLWALPSVANEAGWLRTELRVSDSDLWDLHVGDNDAFAVGDADTVLRSSDRGFTWSATAGTGLGARYDWFGVRFASDQDGWVVGTEGKVRTQPPRRGGWSRALSHRARCAASLRR
jgi:photosystem II stability/assembly factor-like uncharacterized protein